MTQLTLFEAPAAPVEPAGFTADELTALRTERLALRIRELSDAEFFAARDAVKVFGVEPRRWPLFRFFSAKLAWARGLAGGMA